MDDVFQGNLDEQITALRKLNYTNAVIAQACGISEYRVYNRVKALSLPKRIQFGVWDEERQARAKHLLLVEEKTFREIANEFGVSRSSIASLMKRMGLRSVRQRPWNLGCVPWNKGKTYTLGFNWSPPKNRIKPAPRKPPTHIVERPPRTDFQYKPLLELNAGECRYPFGTENYTFCALPAEEGSSWCQHHRKICFMSADAA